MNNRNYIPTPAPATDEEVETYKDWCKEGAVLIARIARIDADREKLAELHREIDHLKWELANARAEAKT